MSAPGSLTLSRDFAVRLRRFSDVFVETGTYRGGGVCAALDGGFAHVFSIELSPALHEEARRNVADFVLSGTGGLTAPERDTASVAGSYTLMCGDSAIKLAQVVHRLTATSAVIFLDSHRMVGDGEAEKQRGGEGWTNSPLARELEVLREAPVRSHLILIDDIDQCGEASMDYLTREQVDAMLLAINPAYRLQLLRGARADSVLAAVPEGFEL